MLTVLESVQSNMESMSNSIPRFNITGKQSEDKANCLITMIGLVVEFQYY